MRPYLVPDAHCAQSRQSFYNVNSLYLDNAELALCRGTLDGLRARFKLRIRWYADSPEAPVWFEIKNRVNTCQYKERAVVHRDAVPRLLTGMLPERDDLVNPLDEDQFRSLSRFCELSTEIGAEARVIVSYEREAWISPHDSGARLTLDRRLGCTAYEDELQPLVSSKRPFFPRIHGPILELKFNDAFPPWMIAIVRLFDLQRRSMPKYVTCMEATRSREWRYLHEQRQVAQ